MRSQLTRHVLRRPLVGSTRTAFASSPAASSTSLVPHPTFPAARRGGRIIIGTSQRRHVFNLFKKPPRALKEVEVEPGYETLLAFLAAQNSNLRPPSASTLVKAWQDFFTYKVKQRHFLNATQAACAERVFRHLGTTTQYTNPNYLSVDNLRIALDAVSSCYSEPLQTYTPPSNPKPYLSLVLGLHHAVRRVTIKTWGIKNRHAIRAELLDSKLRDKPDMPNFGKDLHYLVFALSQYGQARRAKQILLDHINAPSGFSLVRGLETVLIGLAREGREDDLNRLVSTVTEAHPETLNPRIHAIMTCFYAERDDIEKTKAWWSTPLPQPLFPTAMTYRAILRFALRNKQETWAMGIYNHLLAQLETRPQYKLRAMWDLTYQYAYLLLGKGIDYIEHMMRVAIERNAESPAAMPTIQSINSLIAASMTKKNAYEAERFISLANTLGMQPDATTYILQVEYRLDAEDVEGALTAFQTMKSFGGQAEDQAKRLNRLIRHMCSAPMPKYEGILDVISFLEQQSEILEPGTVAAICVAFLKNDELYEIMDTLSLHTAYFSIEERGLVLQSFVEYCRHGSHSTSRVWDAYTLLRQFFPETSSDLRVKIMEAFFDRKRADMACHVFGHMRAHENTQIRPTADIYVRCFEGLGRCPDEESLRIVHNMLKMDTNIQMNTRLYNALMIGYIAIDESHRALDYWREITTSLEGPSYNTLVLVFRAYEVQSEGDGPAKELWKKMTKMELDIPEEVLVAYATTLAAHSHPADAKKLLQDAHLFTGQRPTALSVGHVFNALPSAEMKGEFESWAKTEFRSEWKHLMQHRRRAMHTDGLKRFKIPRPWEA